MKKEAPIAIGLVAGLLWLISSYFTGSSLLAAVHLELNNWFLLVQGWMVLVGVINITRVHGHRVARRRADWPYSLVAISGMYAVMFFGIFIAKNAANPTWKLIYSQIIAPLNATVYSTLVFYIASASYRAFRARNLQSTILLISAVLMMIGRVPLGALISPAFPKVAGWILNVPSVAGMRGIQISAAFGGIATALRVLTGIERVHLGGAE
ncbi:MAG: hypothetical protein ACM3WU_04955 [Bacillota bacterium]